MRNWQAIVSLERLDKYLWSSELENGAVIKLPFSATAPAVKVKGASFKWEPEAEIATLTNINLQIPRGALVTVVGKVGSGKSSLLASLLGEIPKLSGEVIIHKGILLGKISQVHLVTMAIEHTSRRKGDILSAVCNIAM